MICSIWIETLKGFSFWRKKNPYKTLMKPIHFLTNLDIIYIYMFCSIWKEKPEGFEFLKKTYKT